MIADMSWDELTSLFTRLNNQIEEGSREDKNAEDTTQTITSEIKELIN